MMAQENQKAALVTGGAKRIGRAVSLMLAGRGYDVAVTYRTSEKEALLLVDEIRERGNNAGAFNLDLFYPETIPGTLEEIHAEFPGLELIVNNASIFERREFRESSLDDLDRNLSVHLRSPYVLVNEFAKFAENGQVINILDSRITAVKTAYFAYLLSKKALADFTEMAAVALGPEIRVNAVAPGFILPPEGEGDNYIAKFAEKIPAGRKGDINDVLNAVRFLLDNPYVTGQVLFVDGGRNLAEQASV